MNRIQLFERDHTHAYVILELFGRKELSNWPGPWITALPTPNLELQSASVANMQTNI